MTRSRGLIAAGLLIAAAVAVSSVWLASSEPDGLVRVAEDEGFADRAEDPGFEILPGYSIPGVDDERVSTALAGIVGIVLVTAISLGAGRLLRGRGEANRHPHDDPPVEQT
jgi:hypothetical protein